MNEQVKSYCDLLIKNREIMNNEFKWNYSMMNLVGALAYSSARKEADPERLKECSEIVRKNSGIFSAFRSTSNVVIVSKMAISPDPERYFSELKEIYEKVAKAGSWFTDSAYLVQVSMLILDSGARGREDEIIARYQEIYQRMAKIHPILTSSENLAYAVLLAMTGRDVDTIILEMETCYTYLYRENRAPAGANEIQALSEILALTDGDMKEKCDRVVELYNTFKANGVKYGTSYSEFSSLGVLIDIPQERNALVKEILETSDYLKTQKGFGSWSMDNKQRLMFAAMIVGNSYNTGSTAGGGSLLGGSAGSSILDSTVIGSTISMVIAEEIAILICICMINTSSSTVTT